MRLLKRLITLSPAACLLAAGLIGPALSLASEREDNIKAAFIFNFARFTEWPAGSFREASSRIRICFRSDHPLANALDDLNGKAIGDRKIETVAFQFSAQPVERCHIAMVLPGENKVPRKGLLTIGDTPDFAELGGVVGLVQVGRQIRFEINEGGIDRAGLRMSSKLLRLALKVIR
ncbi:MAG: YfiR family protein [Pseudomonadota bacterium]